MNGRAEREAYIGHEAQHMRGVLALKHPIKNGIIQNWDEMEKVRGTFLFICIHVFRSILKDKWYNWILDLASHIPANACGSRRSPGPTDGSSHESPGESSPHGGDHVRVLQCSLHLCGHASGSLSLCIRKIHWYFLRLLA